MADAYEFDAIALHNNRDFQALYESPESTVSILIRQLEHDLLTKVSSSESERVFAQGRLRGLREVRDRVAQMSEHLLEQHQSSEPKPEPRAELKFLPRTLQGIRNRTFPAMRAVQKGT